MGSSPKGVGPIRNPVNPPRNPPEALAHDGVETGNVLDDKSMPTGKHSPRAEDASNPKGGPKSSVFVVLLRLVGSPRRFRNLPESGLLNLSYTLGSWSAALVEASPPDAARHARLFKRERLASFAFDKRAWPPRPRPPNLPGICKRNTNKGIKIIFQNKVGNAKEVLHTIVGRTSNLVETRPNSRFSHSHADVHPPTLAWSRARCGSPCTFHRVRGTTGEPCAQPREGEADGTHSLAAKRFDV